MSTSTRNKPILEKLEPYMGFLGPMAMIVLILAFMGGMEPARYFRLSNMNQVLLDTALYMPMAMAMAQSLPLKQLPDDADRDFWVPDQVNKEGSLQALQDATGAEAVPYSGTLEKPIQIAHDQMSAEEIDALEVEAFRFSGVGTLER